MAFGDRRTPLTRTEFKRKAPVNAARNPRSPIRQRSKRRTTQMRTDRIPKIEAMVEAGRGCEVCPVLAMLGIQSHCAHRIEGLHERRKSGSGGSRENPLNLVPSCNWANGFLEDAVGTERELIEGTALVVRPNDPAWDAMGARAWRERT